MLEGYSLQTLKAYTVQHDLLVKHFTQEVKLEEIEHRDLKAYLVKDSDRLKPARLGHRIRFVKFPFKWANDEGIIKNNPARKLKELKHLYGYRKSLLLKKKSNIYEKLFVTHLRMHYLNLCIQQVVESEKLYY
ncbi:hypothetical protein ACERII_00155 [Evansella sp. AB-rgal1]|uniref:hypothetical protein n=1 Tax=Evansella sp. AB-rgal1 TaxID=3242696 RepID=UPI00359ED099